MGWHDLLGDVSRSWGALLGWLDAAARGLSLPVAAGILLDQLDELFIDANYVLRGLHRRASRSIPWRTLERVPQKHLAILVAAWREADVIRQMLEHNLANLDYDRTRYTFFCGTYPNDPETQAEVEIASRRSPAVRKVVVPHDGPTSKADCLNWIYQAVMLEERRRGRRFDILLVHGTDDVIHPMALRVYSLLIPRHELVQTPLLSLHLPLRKKVAATYIDELAERHLKDLLVREAMGGLIPSAGVASAFDREAFAQIARARGERPFDVESLTEDYEIGLAFRLAGKRVHFACRALEAGPPAAEADAEADAEAEDDARRSRIAARGQVAKGGAGSMAGDRSAEEIIATRVVFPDGIAASVRQRSRSILGIALQAWRQVGWPGSLSVRYGLWRDRKMLFTSFSTGLAYLLASYAGLRAGAAALGLGLGLGLGQLGHWPSTRLLPGGWRGPVLQALLVVNLLLLGWRITVKATLVGRLYGPGHALLSAPRMLLGSLIGIGASARAVGLFIRHRLTGKPWRRHETKHAFPGPAVLRARQRRLGEILTEEHGLDRQGLELALSLQQAVGRPLGEVLSLLGLVSEQTVTRALAELHDMAEGDPWAGRAPEHLLVALSEEDAERLGVVPIASGAGGIPRIAAEAPLEVEAVSALEERFGREVEVVLAPPAAVRRSRQQAYRRLLASGGAQDGSTTPVARQRVRPEEVDWSAVAQIGHGYCAFYAILPLLPAVSAPGAGRGTGARNDDAWGRAGAVRALAAAFPVHPEVLATVSMRLRAAADTGAKMAPGRAGVRGAARRPRRRGEPRGGAEAGAAFAAGHAPLDLEPAIEIVPAPLLDLDVALALCPSATVAEAAPGTLTLELLRALESSTESDPRVAACGRAGRLGLPITSSSGSGPVHWAVLPAALQGRDPIFIHGLADRSLILATVSPSPRLFRTVGNLYPRWAIAWRVSLPDAQHNHVPEELPCMTRTLPTHPSLSN